MTMISEIATYLAANSVGTLATNIFYGQMPDIDQNVTVCVYDRVGPKPSVDIPDIKHPMFQVMVRAKTYDLGKAKLDAIRELLQDKINVYLVSGGIKFRFIQAMSEGGWIGLNASGKEEFSINFHAEIVE